MNQNTVPGIASLFFCYSIKKGERVPALRMALSPDAEHTSNSLQIGLGHLGQMLRGAYRHHHVPCKGLLDVREDLHTREHSGASTTLQARHVAHRLAAMAHASNAPTALLRHVRLHYTAQCKPLAGAPAAGAAPVCQWRQAACAGGMCTSHRTPADGMTCSISTTQPHGQHHKKPKSGLQ